MKDNTTRTQYFKVITFKLEVQNTQTLLTLSNLCFTINIPYVGKILPFLNFVFFTSTNLSKGLTKSSVGWMFGNMLLCIISVSFLKMKIFFLLFLSFLLPLINCSQQLRFQTCFQFRIRVLHTNIHILFSLHFFCYGIYKEPIVNTQTLGNSTNF